MEIKTTVTVTLTQAEKDTLAKARYMLERICNAYAHCSDCPLHTHCRPEGDANQRVYEVINNLLDK